MVLKKVLIRLFYIIFLSSSPTMKKINLSLSLFARQVAAGLLLVGEELR